MRPDRIDWNDKSDHSSLRFRPRAGKAGLRHLWPIVVMATQCAITLAVFGAVDWHGIVPIQAWAGSLHSLGLSVTETWLAVTMSSMLAALVTAIVAIPILWLRWRRWNEVLADLREMAGRLARGGEPSPVAVRGGDELSYLAIAFNDMAGRLCEQRRQLLRVNEDLERRVEKRTAQLAEAAARLEELASSDVLTSLPNRYAMMGALEEMFRASREAGVDLVCLAIDLDGFKGVNDTLGHAAGDELLKIAGDLFKEVCREGDVPARLGGDEFIILLPMRQPRDAEPIANRLLENFGARARTWLDGRCVPAMPSLSVGIATLEHSGAASPEELLNAADEALYIAKRAGKGRYEFWRKPGDGKASSEAA